MEYMPVRLRIFKDDFRTPYLVTDDPEVINQIAAHEEFGDPGYASHWSEGDIITLEGKTHEIETVIVNVFPNDPEDQFCTIELYLSRD